MRGLSLRLTLCTLSLLCLLGSTLPPARCLLAATPPSGSVEQISFAVALQKQIDLARERLAKYVPEFDQELDAFMLELPQLRSAKEQLMLWRSGASEPWDYLALQKGGRVLRGRLTEGLAVPHEREQLLSEFIRSVEGIAAESRAQLANIEDPELRSELEETLGNLEALKADVQKLLVAFQLSLAPAKRLQSELHEAEILLKDLLAKSWKGYYTTPLPTFFSPDLARRLGQLRENWQDDAQELHELLAMAGGWQHVLDQLGSAGLLAGSLLLLGFLLLRILKARLGRHGPLAQLHGALCAAVLAVLFFQMARHCSFIVYVVFLSLGEIFLSAALVFFARYLRAGQERKVGNLRTPLWPLWSLYALGFLLNAWPLLPELLIQPVLALALLGASLWMLHRSRLGDPSEKLDRFLTRSMGFVLLVPAVVSMAGLPQLAALTVSILFYLLLALRFAISAVRFLANWEAGIAKGGTPVLMSILSGLSFPLIFAALLVLFLWLLSSQFGGEYVFLEFFTREYHFQAFAISAKRLFMIILFYYLTKAAIALSRAFIRDMNQRRPLLHQGAVASLSTLASYVWWGVYCLLVLFLLGVSMTSVAVVAGGLSVGIGFGLQNIVNNFVSGLILLVGRSIQAGDVIQLGETLGMVKEVTIRNTRIDTYDNVTIFVPNSALVSNQIINWSHQDPKVRREVEVGVAYGSDLELVRSLLLQAAGEVPKVLRQPPPSVLLANFGDSALVHRLRVWIDDPGNASSIMSEVRRSIERLFRAHNVEIAFPQTDLHLRSLPVPAEGANEVTGATTAESAGATTAPDRERQELRALLTRLLRLLDSGGKQP